MKIYRTSDGLKLHKNEWLIDQPKAMILLVHGLGEHSGRYEYQQLAKAFNIAGYSVTSFDHRGGGRSDGLVAHIDRFTQLTEDLAMVADAEKPNSIPFILLSHSLGGLIATRYLIDYQNHPFDLAIFSAPAVKADDSMAPLLRKIAPIVSKFFPKLPAAKLAQNMISKDSEVRERYQADPLIYKGKVRARKGYEVMKSMEYVMDRFSYINTPVLIMHGAADKITDPIGSQLLYDGVSSIDKTLKYFDGLYHEIFNEPERTEVISYTINWIEEHL